MNYYGAKDLATSFRTVRKNTLTIANEIGEEHYGFHATPQMRSVGDMLVHIALGPMFQEEVHRGEKKSTLVGMNFPALMAKMAAEEKKPRNKAEIITLLTEKGEEFANWLETLSDEFLAERVGMPEGATPDSKTRFEMLMSVKEHEMHHRGQLMLIQRLIGLVPHGTREMMARMQAMSQAQAQPARA